MGGAVRAGVCAARRREWRHSDLELGVLIEQRDIALPYFSMYDAEWAEQNEDMLAFLGLANADKAGVTALVERISHSRNTR